MEWLGIGQKIDVGVFLINSDSLNPLTIGGQDTMNKKGAIGINQLSGVVLVLVVAAITLGLGLTVLDSFTSALTANTVAYNATSATTSAVGALGSTWFSIIVTVVAAVIILGLIIRSLMGAGN